MSETPADELQRRAILALTPFVDFTANDDGSVSFSYEGALCSLRAVTLSPGLDVISVTCVLAWDRPLGAKLFKRVADRNDALQFGSIAVIGNGKLGDVVMRYTFPATGLAEDALATMLLLILSGAQLSRKGLLP